MNPTLRLVVLGLQLTFLAGCVSQARFDEARSALLVEQEAHRRTNAALYQVSQKVDKLEAALAQREREIAGSAEKLSAAELALTNATTERDTAVQTVDQLREELARVGDHLRAFADQKKTLSIALDSAEARAKNLEELEKAVARRVLVVRDVSVLLNEAIAMGEVELDVSQGHPVLRLDPRSTFVSGSGDLQPGTGAAAGALARAMKPRPETRIRLVRKAADEARATAELERIAKKLEAEGIPRARIEIAVEKIDGEEGPIELHVL